MLRSTFLSIDPALGRLDYDSLSDQALMEMVVDGVEEGLKQNFQDENGNFLDVCEWPRVTCSKDSRVHKIAVSGIQFTDKQFAFQFIPDRVTDLQAYGCSLHGTLNTEILPPQLEIFYAFKNSLHGTLNCAMFPRRLRRVLMSENLFIGSLVLSDLPDTLTSFSANNNEFSGKISLNDLPPALEELWIADNALSGSIHIELLPSSIRSISLRGNKFNGRFSMLQFPVTLRFVDFSRNDFSSKAVLRKATKKMHFELKIQNVSMVVDEDDEKHEWHEEIVRV